MRTFNSWLVTVPGFHPQRQEPCITPYGHAMQGLVSEIATDAELGRVYREQVVEPRRAQLAPVIERGIARGDLRPDTDIALMHELLLGPVFYRLLLSGGQLDRKLTTRIVDAVLGAFAPPGGTTESQRRRRRAREKVAAEGATG
jgi:Tetracyclin repressor-like, C-terminal domain